jgi:membrane associated rhomboid family serine protease
MMLNRHSQSQLLLLFILIIIIFISNICLAQAHGCQQYDHHHNHDFKATPSQHATTTTKNAVLVVPSNEKAVTISWNANMARKNKNNYSYKKKNRKKRNMIPFIKKEETGDIASAMQLRGGGQRLRQLHKKQTRRFAFHTIASYSILHKLMTLYGPIEFIQHSNAIIHILWLLFVYFDIDIVQLEKYFLVPRSWNALRKNPLSIFGSAFSHCDTGHLLANYSVFTLFAPLAFQILGTSKFSHLYLVSILTSSLVTCVWQYCALSLFGIGNGEEAKFGLGASGAISGVMACVCLSQYYGQTLMSVGDSEVPLNVLWLVGYVLSDVAGLLQQRTLMKVSNLVIDGHTDEAVDLIVNKIFSINKDEEPEKSDEEDHHEKGYIDKSIGYDAHLGGALGGVMFDHFIIKRNGFFSPRKLLKYMRWSKKEIFGALIIWVVCIALIETFM